MDASQIKRELIDRGVTVNPPCSQNSLEDLERDLGINLDSYFRSIYLTFDGFEANQETGFVSVWTLERIRNHLTIQSDKHDMIAFADILLDSDIVLCQANDSRAPVVTAIGCEEIAPTFASFLEGVAMGRFNF